MQYKVNGRKAFSLIELVIVVVIIGIISAIAIPKLSRGAKGASESAEKANIAIIENAIELYTAEHGGTRPTPALINSQLIAASNDAGVVKSTGTVSEPDTTFPWGPYLKTVPVVPYGTKKGNTLISDSATPIATTGWLYDTTNGRITMNP